MGGNFFQHICLLLESMRRFPEQTSADGVSLPPPAPVRSSGVRCDARNISSIGVRAMVIPGDEEGNSGQYNAIMAVDCGYADICGIREFHPGDVSSVA